MTLKSSVSELTSYSRSGTAPNRARIQKLVHLYALRKAPNFEAALNAVPLLSSNQTTPSSQIGW